MFQVYSIRTFKEDEKALDIFSRVFEREERREKMSLLFLRYKFKTTFRKLKVKFF